METVRGLLTLGNGKVGEAIHLWSLPAVETCPGRSDTCARHCYARRHRYQFPAVIERLDENYRVSLDPAFPSRMTREVLKKGCLVVRVHASGDFYSASYADAWRKVIKACPATTFYCYTRSHAVPDIHSVLVKIAGLANARVWFSYDRDIPVPDTLPPRVRACYLQTEEREVIPKVDLVFRVRRLRKERLPLAMVCPSESPGRRELTCGSCGKCFRT